MIRLLIATRNRGKVLEIRSLLGPGSRGTIDVLTVADLPDVAETREDGKTFEENARIKALHYATAHRLLCLADDSGLVVDALGGRPGVLSARYAGEGATDGKNNARLLEELKDLPRPWSAAYVCSVVAAFPGRVVATAEGLVAGEIVPEARGTSGFGYDPVFRVEGTDRTMAELSLDEKNRVSHRGQAIRAVLEDLRRNGLLG